MSKIYLKVFVILCLQLHSLYLFPAVIKGRVTDTENRMELIGATVYITELKKGIITGLDGSYIIKNLPSGKYSVTCNYIGYKPLTRIITIKENEQQILDFGLSQHTTELEQVIVTAKRDQSTEVSARNSEKTSNQIINVVSAKTIELSPDMNVANAVQRMSGVTIDKTSSSTGQYALLRGMDKRYIYTLVNGIKIPSTHNKHRYVSLDMFPADMVDRIEVSKSLTPEMEGDAIGGVVNLVMKNAPEKAVLQINASAGFSQFFMENDFITFNSDVINPKSPYELNESGYRAVPSDFPSGNLVPRNVDIPVNYFGNITAGNQFFNKRLGWILSGSYQNNYNGESSLYFKDDLSRDGNNLPVLKSMQERIYTDNRINSGIHNKFDYQFNNNHGLELYTAYMSTANTQIREVENTDLTVSYDPENGNINRTHSTRFRYNIQSLFNATLQGQHSIGKSLTSNWSAVYSKADNKTPDEATVVYGNNLENFQPVRQYIDFDGSDRIWRRNSDQDIAGYLDFTYVTKILGFNTEIISGGMYREKERSSFYNKYTLNAIVNISNPDTSYTSFYSEKGTDWNTYDEVLWRVYNPRGTVAVGENYDAYETVIAGYAMLRLKMDRLQITGGARVESTDQGYSMLYPVGEPAPTGNQKYTEVLPSIHFKYSPTVKQNLRLSYYRALNKPGFQEIVPFIDASEEPVTAGNSNLKHAEADNFDLRWEYFPAPIDQFMAGLFYKNIKNPIEFAFDKFMNVSQNIVYTPVNSENAINYGFEIDVTKFYREWGIKANYTWTSSSITSKKLSRVKDSGGNDSTAYVSQKRPLFGQSAHVGNISLLYKGTLNGISAQLAVSYTGDRIYTVSRYIDNDMWQKGILQLDASAEKRFNNGVSLFFKANNLLNSHLYVYIINTNPINSDVPYHDVDDENTLIRDEYSLPSYLFGVRYKF